MKYYISDLHFGHKNIIAFDGHNGSRGFDSVEERTEYIVNNWNNVIDKGDDVYILGDVSWTGAVATVSILERLEGHKHLILGNHDNKLNNTVLTHFKSVQDYKRVKDGEQYVNLSHYPLFAYEDQFRGGIHLYGHVHNTRQAKLYKEACNQVNISTNFEIPMVCFNVGCMLDYMDYTPRTLDYVMKNGGFNE